MYRKGRKSRERLLQFLMLTVAAACVLCAQSFTGAITGTIADPSGAGVPNAKFAAVEERSNITTETVSDSRGSYVFPALRSGVYRLEAEASWFRKFARSGIEARVNDRLQIDLAMVLSSVSETVEVTGATPLVESQSGAVGNVIENRKIIDLPLNTRNPFQLALLSPGVVLSPAAVPVDY